MQGLIDELKELVPSARDVTESLASDNGCRTDMDVCMWRQKAETAIMKAITALEYNQCPHVVTSKEGRSYCSLAESRPDSQGYEAWINSHEFDAREQSVPGEMPVSGAAVWSDDLRQYLSSLPVPIDHILIPIWVVQKVEGELMQSPYPSAHETALKLRDFLLLPPAAEGGEG